MALAISPDTINAAVAVGVGLVNRLFDRKDRKKDDLVSVGLAVGYFYNFLEPLENAVAYEAFKLYMPDDKKDVTKDSPHKMFEIDDVEIHVIVPKRLDVDAFKACESEFKNSDRGFFHHPKNNRFYGINYIAATVRGKERLSIIDYARPAVAAKLFHEKIFGVLPDDENWASVQYAELAAFKRTLTNLQKLGTGVLVNKMHFKEIG